MCAELATRGVELLNGRSTGLGSANPTFGDPGGHIWEIAE